MERRNDTKVVEFDTERVGDHQMKSGQVRHHAVTRTQSKRRPDLHSSPWQTKPLAPQVPDSYSYAMHTIYDNKWSFYVVYILSINTSDLDGRRLGLGLGSGCTEDSNLSIRAAYSSLNKSSSVPTPTSRVSMAGSGCTEGVG